MRNNSGKTLTIFIILVTILLVSSTAIGFFMYQKENQMRKDLEAQLQESVQAQNKLSEQLKEAKNQLTILEDKNKEADNKINNLMDEAELNEGLRNELKKENASLKDSIEAAKKEKDSIRTDLDMAAKKLQENQELLKAEQDKTKNLLAKVDELKNAQIISNTSASNKMELDKIVVAEDKENKGRILSIDKESEFIVCALGVNQGVKSGDILAVYRGDHYLGDVRITRAQEEMSAADFIPPLTSRKVRNNDTVVLKRS